MAKNWFFLKGGSFIMNAENMADALKNTSLSQDELFIREAFQNIFDEHKDKTKKLEIKISIKELYGPEKQNFVDALQYNEIKNKSPLFHDPNNWFKKGHEELKKINNPSEKLRILEISDHNANGLGGLWNRVETNEDKFHNLVLSITKSKKQDASSTNPLGSYGYGKMVFAMNSDIRSIIYYSHFPETPRTGGADRRLMATSFLPTFYNKNDDIEYTGHAFFGEDSGKAENPKKPLINDEADSFFKKLGFEPRNNGDFGTTVLLPACNISIESIIAAIEKWWWPLFIDQEYRDKIEISIFDLNGKKIIINPARRDEINPFISAARNLKENFSHPGKAKTQQIKIIPKKTQEFPGKLSCLKRPKNSTNQLDNKLAIIRNNLVIEYNEKYFRENEANAIGVFYVSQETEINRIVAASEPPPHDTINEGNGRLIDKYSEYGTKFIRLTKAQLNEKCKDFQTTLNQITHDDQKDVFSFLDEILGPLMKPRNKGSLKPPDSQPRAISIQKTSKNTIVDGKTYSELNFKLGLVKECIEDILECNLQLICSVLRDDTQSPDFNLNIKLENVDSGKIESITAKENKSITLHKTDDSTFVARSKIHPGWITAWTINVFKKENTA